MPDDFDHYYKWLGIPPENQPPNHYRLLGVADFTEDPEVIENAYEQRAAHLRTLQLGQRSALSQQVLNEVAQAHVSLLDPGKKAAYDAELRGPRTAPKQPTLAFPTDGSKTSKPIQPVVALKSGDAANKPSGTKKHFARVRKQKKGSNPLVELAKIIAGGIAGTVIAYFLICWITPNNDFLGLRKPKQPKQTVARSDASSPPPSITSQPTDDDPAMPATPPAEQKAASQATSTPTTFVAEPPPNEALIAETSPNPTSSVADNDSNEPPTPIEADEQRLQRLTSERDAALAKGNVEAALKVVEAIADMTDGDALDRQLELVSRLLDAAEASSDILRATEPLLRLLHEAVDADRKDLAGRHADQVLGGARRSGNADLVRWATLCVLKIQNM